MQEHEAKLRTGDYTWCAGPQADVGRALEAAYKHRTAPTGAFAVPGGEVGGLGVDGSPAQTVEHGIFEFATRPPRAG
jgi:hypothetical protein